MCRKGLFPVHSSVSKLEAGSRRLTCVFADLSQSAGCAFRLPCPADFATVKDQEMVCLSPFLFRYQFLESFLCPFRVLFTAQSDSVGYTVNMGIHSQAWLAKGVG